MSSGTIHVATDWTALGVFFVGLIGVVGGFVGWLIRRFDRIRAANQVFVKDEIAVALGPLITQMSQNTAKIADTSREVVDQGKTLARIEGALGSRIGDRAGGANGIAL